MAPEEQSGSPEDTPTPDSPEGGTPEQQDTDWEKRYKDIQAEYTQTSQEAAELRQLTSALQSDDPQERYNAAEALGLAFVDDQGAQEESQDAALARRLEAVETFLATGQEEAAAQQMQAQDVDQINQALSEFETRLGRDLIDEEVQLIASHAILNRTEEGVPGTAEAVALHEKALEAVAAPGSQEWAKSKRVSTPAVGQEGDEKTSDLQSHTQRVADMTARLNLNP